MFRERLEGAFIEKFSKYIEENNLIKKRSKLLVGVSGGPDSMALLLALLKIKDRLDLSLLVAHVNYHLRGEDSNEDEEFVKRFCFANNLYLVVKSVDLSCDSGMEAKARDIRMDYFYQLLKDYKLDYIVLAHNQRDNAETVLMNIIRGTGITGLRGILPIYERVIHPLIKFSREEIYTFLKADGLSWREDKSNQNCVYTRNKIRNQLIPWIEENLNSAVQDKLVSLSQLMSETEDYINFRVNRLFSQIVRENNDYQIVLDLDMVKSSAKLIRFYLFKRCFIDLTKASGDFYNVHSESIENILFSEGSRSLDLPKKIQVFKQYRKLIFRKINSRNRTFSIGENNVIKKGVTKLESGDYIIQCKGIRKRPNNINTYYDNVALLDKDKIKFPIIIRRRQNGDKFTPLGMKKSKKLKEFLINEKIPKFERDNLLILEDSEKIIWVGGVRLDNRVAVDETTTNFLKIEINIKENTNE